MPPREVTVACENPRLARRVKVGEQERAIPATVEEQAVRTTAACSCGAAAVGEQDAGRAVSVGLQEVPGVSPAGGAFTKTVKDPTKFEAARARAAQVGHLDSDAQLHRFLRADLEKEDQEVFVVVGLDIHNDLRCYAEVARGQRHSVRVEPGDILRPVLIEGCAGFVVAHNHPSGSCQPSPEDRRLTHQLREAASVVRLVFVDHLVIGSGGSYYTFADRKAKRAR